MRKSMGVSFEQVHHAAAIVPEVSGVFTSLEERGLVAEKQGRVRSDKARMALRQRGLRRHLGARLTGSRTMRAGSATLHLVLVTKS